MTGPVFPIPAAFGDSCTLLEIRVVESYCAYLLEHGATVLMTTAGTSNYDRLDEDRRHQLNRAVERLCPRGCILDTPHDVEHGDRLVRYPGRFYDEPTLVDWFRNHAALGPIYVHVTPLRDGRGPVGPGARFWNWSVSALERLREIPNVIGIKEECDDTLARWAIANTPWHVIVAAGSMSRAQRVGATAWLAGIGSLWPEAEVGGITTVGLELERQMFRMAEHFGWHPTLRVGLQVLGLLPTWECSPWPNPAAHPEDLWSAMRSLCAALREAFPRAD